MSLSAEYKEDSLTEFYQDVIAGLSQPNREISSKYFYDQRGSLLFEQICNLPEYYPTRTEVKIFEENLKEIVEFVGSRARLLEFGSGSSVKTRLLLTNLQELECYLPLDISEQHLMQSTEELKREFPKLTIIPLHRDYLGDWNLPQDSPRENSPANTASIASAYSSANSLVFFYPGSTIGNFHPHDAKAFVTKMRENCTTGDKLIIGVDLIKDHQLIHAAYNDSQGITAEFNLNILHRLKNELEATVELEAFCHQAPFNAEHSRVEMQLVAKRKTEIRLQQNSFIFEENDAITTEFCYKHTPQNFSEMISSCGFSPAHFWSDSNQHFGLFAFSAL
ncbi:MAG: L-histidine N(alpha)-methyltransferase [Sumerlaeia bacterium]